MFFQKYDESLTEKEKIDAIYEMLKNQERRQYFSRIGRWIMVIITILSLGQLYIMMVAGNNTELMHTITSFVGKQMGNIVGPIVDNVLKSNPSLLPPGANVSQSSSGNVSAGLPTDSPTPNTHINQPKTRDVNTLLKDPELLKAAADAYNKKQGTN